MQQSYSPYSDYDMAHRTLGGFPNVPHIEIPNNILSPSGSSTPKPGPPPGATVSVTPTTRMKTYGVANVPQQTRHARRIYVGGIPPNYTDEDGLRDFFNAAISHGIGEDNDHSHVLSVYIDQKKCFAFIELKAIEIASACLELDGVIMKNIVLRILRANEYKPELVPPSMNKSIRFDLTGFQFGISNNAGSTTGEFNEGSTEKTLDSIIQYNNLNVLESGSVIIVGYPYDDLATRKCAATRGVGSAHAPKIMRNSIRKFKYGVVENSEYGQDLSKLKILDIGDVIGGKSPDETKTNLTTTVSELILRGGIPFIVGGSNELIYSSISGLMNVVGGNICTIDIASRMNTRLLEDSRFCQLRSTNAAFPSCEGRFVLFGAQGSQCSKDETKYIEARGGNVVWLNKDLRRNMSQKSVPEKFEELLKDLASLNPENPLPIAVTLDAGALCCMLAPMSNSNNGPLGLHFEEVAEMVRIAGADPNVR